MMKTKYRERMSLALQNAAEMILSHIECGLEPQDVNEDSENGLIEYGKACERVAKKLERMASKY